MDVDWRMGCFTACEISEGVLAKLNAWMAAEPTCARLLLGFVHHDRDGSGKEWALQLALFVCAWEQRERLDLSLVPALQDQMHACTRVTTEMLPSSRCRQHHLLPRITTDFLALLPQKARERASMSDARSDGFGQRCFHGRQVGRRLVRAHRHQSPSILAWRDELDSVLLRCSGFIYALMRSACAGNALNHHSRC